MHGTLDSAPDSVSANGSAGLCVKANLLVVEDEPHIQELIALHLEAAGHTVTRAMSVREAEREIAPARPDLILLDWMLPDASGLDWVRALRSNPPTREIPIIMLSAKAHEHDKVQGLDAGVDDYLTKPFSPRELLSRIAALLRRRAPQLSEASVHIAGLQLNHATHVVTADGSHVHLGPTEFRMLQFLMTHPERAHSRQQPVRAVWGNDVEVEDRTVDVYIGRLRDALRPTRHEF